jgi:antitoxin component YwqK of YwqJK toxin-antitoxin module
MRIGLSLALLTMTWVATGCMTTQQVEVVDQSYVHKYGVEVPSDYWDSAGREGAIISTMADGVVVMNTYSNGILHGETTYTYPHSETIHRAEVYQNGELEKETVYFCDSIPMQETHYVPSSHVKYVTNWYSGGSPKSYETFDGELIVTGEYYNLQNQRDSFVENLEGTRLSRDDYGQLLSQDTIQQGRLALSTTYHPNGTPKEMISYQNNLVDGIKKTYYPGGEPNTLEEWKMGRQEGMTTVFQNGEKFAIIPYVAGQKQGIERRFKDEEIIVKEIPWVAGKMHGPMRTYVGDSVKTEWYFKGSPTTAAEFDALSYRPS